MRDEVLDCFNNLGACRWKAREAAGHQSIGGFTVANMALQQEDQTPHWSRGDLVKVRSKTADNWRDAYVLIQRGRNLLLVIPEGMIYPDGIRRTRLSLIAEEEAGAYHRSMDGADYEVRPSRRGQGLPQ